MTAERLKQSCDGNYPEPVVVPNPLSVEEVSAGDSGRFESKRVVYLGRLTTQKGADRLIPLAQRVNRDQTCLFHVYGSGELEGSLSRAPYIWYRGSLPWDRREEAFSEASALVVPSRAEPFGMVVLEAMQHGVPVIYPRDAGVAEVLDAGIAVDTADQAAMAEAICRLLSDWQYWEDVVSRQLEAIADYPDKGFERVLHDYWQGVLTERDADEALT